MRTYEQKFNAAVDELSVVGIWKSNSVPPYLHLVRKLGMQPKPPHYASFLARSCWYGDMVWWCLGSANALDVLAEPAVANFHDANGGCGCRRLVRNFYGALFQARPN